MNANPRIEFDVAARVQPAFRAVFALLCAWLLLSLYYVNIEFDDGYATIANAQYFLNQTAVVRDYFMQFLAVAEYVQLERHGEIYEELSAGLLPLLVMPIPGTDQAPLISVRGFPVAELKRQLGLTETSPSLRFLGFRVHSYCDISGCRSLADPLSR